MNRRQVNTLSSLPKIVQFLGTTDLGPVAEAEGRCPHCDALGRYVHSFRTEDGRTLGAMSGCLKLFPVHPIAKEHLRLSEKLRSYKAKGCSGLNRWDKTVMERIEAFYAGTATESDVMAVIGKRDAWRAARGRRPY